MSEIVFELKRKLDKQTSRNHELIETCNRLQEKINYLENAHLKIKQVIEINKAHDKVLEIIDAHSTNEGVIIRVKGASNV